MSKKITKPVVADLSKPEKARVEAVLDRAQARPRGPRLKLEMTDVLQVSYGHPDPIAGQLLTMADMGTCDQDFLNGITKQIASIGSHGNRIDEGNSNFLLSVVRAVQPKDELETLLAMQMGAVHSATMMMARRLNHVETLPQQDAAERALNKLARTYTAQMEALRKHRNGGKQTVVVQHVNVESGGQAIVGNVKTGGRGKDGK